MKRYLIYLSYIGTQFRGIQIQRVLSQPHIKDDKTVAGLLQLALERCNVTNVPVVIVSSRTDQGVHALRNAVHVDLDCGFGEIKPRFILSKVNTYFKTLQHDIRVQEVRIVSDDFSCRYHAKERQYLYRFAVKKPNIPILDAYNTTASVPKPVLENDRCHFILDSKFDVEAVHAASQLFVGTKDFLAFLGKPIQSLRKNKPITVRTLDSLELRPGRPCIVDDSYTELYNFWEVHCSAKSFLYNQVRRMVGVLLAVARNHMTLEDVNKLFDNPKIDSWNVKAMLAPAYGLYLKDIIYDEQDLLVKENENENENLKNIDLKNFTGSIHDKINLRQTMVKR